MQVRFAELAKLEFDEARAWYRAIRPELGRSFSQEVRSATQRITHVPLMSSTTNTQQVIALSSQHGLLRASQAVVRDACCAWKAWARPRATR